tara:strand:- start:1162 stop:1938 length:777 start_codon:yes stop_codon:yes gene_type:complete
MGYYLIDNENPNASLRENGKKGNYYPKRSRDIQGIVVHTAEGGTNATAIAKYLSQTDRVASAHVVIDSEKIVNLLPDDYTAFHVRSHNSKSLGLEIAYYASNWGTDKEYEDKVITLTAKWCAEKSEVYSIPVRRISYEDWLKGEKGYISHSELDPERRSDPGANFPWEKLFTLIKGKAYRKAQRQAPKWNGRVFINTHPSIKGDDVAQWQDAAGGITADGYYGRNSTLRCKEIQKKAGLVEDGIVGPQTWYATFKQPA